MKRNIYIAGAHSRAQTLAVYLTGLYADVSIEAYLVNNKEKNTAFIGDVPVIHFDKYTKLHTEYAVYIGTRGIYHERLTTELRKCGFTDIIPVTVEQDLNLRNAYLEKYFALLGREFLKLDKLTECRACNSNLQGTVYVARSIGDKALCKAWRIKKYEQEIQAGAALTGRRLTPGILTDDNGDNISSQNKRFCELAVLYWIWKNAKDEVVGLEHYRRHFILPADWLERMEAHNIDVILPIPLYVSPSLAENYKSRHDPSDWEYMMNHLKSQDEDLYNDAEEFFRGNLYSPCNMFIMRKNVLDDLCRWIFPILFAVAEHGGQKTDAYQNRYPGFLSERLMTFFFGRHKDKYKVVYADKNFLQ